MTFIERIKETIELICDTCETNEGNCLNCEFYPLCDCLYQGNKPCSLKSE